MAVKNALMSDDPALPAMPGEPGHPALPPGLPEDLRAYVLRLAAVVNILNRSPVVVFLWRVAEGWPVDFVTEGVRQFGYSPEDFTSGRVSWPGITHPDDVPRLEAEVAEHRRLNRTEFSQEYRLITASGTVRWVDDRTMAVTGPDGQLTHFAGAIRDITARKEAEEALRGSEARLRLALDSGGMGMWEWDLESGVVHVTATQFDLAGLKPEDGQIEVAYFFEQVHPDDLPSLREAIRHCVEDGAPYVADYRMRQPDGSYRWLAGRGRVVRDAAGKAVRMMGVNYDISASKAAEAALRDSDARLTVALAAGGMGVWDWDLSTNRSRVNDRELELFDLPGEAGEVDVGLFQQRVHPEDRDTLEARIAESLATKTDVTTEVRVVCRDGTIRWLAGHGRVQVDAAGKPVRLMGVNYDVTPRRVAESALRESEERYRTLAEAAHDMIFVIGRDDRVRYVNRFTASQFGCKTEALIGRPRLQLFPAVEAGRPPQDLWRDLEGGRPVYEENETALPTGTMWLGTWLVPLRNAAGEVDEVLGVARDITARRRAEEQLAILNSDLERRVEARTVELRRALRELEDAQEALRTREAQYRGLAESTRDILFSIDSRGLVRYIGPQTAAYGFDPNSIIGHPLVDFLHPDDRSRVLDSVRDVLSGRPPPAMEMRILSRTGDAIWLEALATPQRSPDGRVRTLTGVLRDITERKEAELARQQHERQLHALAARLATVQDEEQRRLADWLHDDLAQLLASAVYRLAELRKPPLPASQKEVAQELTDILTAAQQKVRRLSRELSASTFYRLGLEEALEKLCVTMTDMHGVHFAFTGDGKEKPLASETGAVLLTVVRELMFNVVKHAGVTRARVAARRSGKRATIIVEDRGRGFATSPDATTLGANGEGLGLFNVHERLLRIGGDIAVASKAGTRTRVTIRVPLKASR